MSKITIEQYQALCRETFRSGHYRTVQGDPKEHISARLGDRLVLTDPLGDYDILEVTELKQKVAVCCSRGGEHTEIGTTHSMPRFFLGGLPETKGKMTVTLMQKVL